MFLLLNFGFCSIATEKMKTFAIPFPLVDCNISPPSTSCVCVCLMCVCVCVWGGGGGENERGRKESMGERDVATETGGGGGTCRRHQSIGPPDAHSCWAMTHKP